MFIFPGAVLSKQENLKEMNDVSSGMASTIIQIYLKDILEAFLHPNSAVRQAALGVIQMILAQGLVHPVQVSATTSVKLRQSRNMLDFVKCARLMREKNDKIILREIFKRKVRFLSSPCKSTNDCELCFENR